ncbi:DUF4252 domain-containing protein [Pseudomonadota bacterium]
MKTSIFRKILTVCATLMISLPAMAQEDSLKDYPGYVDFGELSSIFGEPSVQISVGESLLGLVSSLSASEDPEAAELFNRLNGVRVNVFETTSMASGAVDYVKETASTLNKLGWEPVVTVNTADEQVRIYMMINNDQVEGITVMTVEETEAVFINVIGSISPEELGKVMNNFDIDINGGHDGHDDDDATG